MPQPIPLLPIKIVQFFNSNGVQSRVQLMALKENYLRLLRVDVHDPFVLTILLDSTGFALFHSI